MTRLLEEAIARISALPPAAQERIGEELLSHVVKVERLRAELAEGVRSLNRGEGKPLDIQDVKRRARAIWDKVSTA